MAGLTLPMETHVLQAFVSEAVKPLIRELFGLLIVFSQSSAVAPFIYTLF